MLEEIARIAGSFCVFCGCAAIGIKESRKLREHISVLSGLQSALETIEAEIGCKLSPIPAAIRAALTSAEGGRKGGCRDFLSRCVSEIDQKGAHNFGCIWRESAEVTLTVLSDSEIQVLSELSGTLGNYSADEQIAAIVYTRKRLGDFLMAAEKERDRSGKMYVTLGLTMGVAAVIILL